MFHFDGFGRNWGWSFVVLGSLLAEGCDSESDSNNATSKGQVTDEWRGFCLATFTSEVIFKDSFGDVSFTARSGEEYLLTEYGTFGSEPQVEIAYLTPMGPVTFPVPVTGGPETFPFTSNCTFDAAVQYEAVFTDIVVYDSEALTNRLCSLAAGTVVLRDMSANSGFSAVTMGFGGPQTYEVMLNSLGALCGGAESGYVSVPETQLFGATTWLVPITVVLRPE